ncbi:MAG: TonB-dependent receptor [Robiginitomaculum sp.]
MFRFTLKKHLTTTASVALLACVMTPTAYAQTTDDTSADDVIIVLGSRRAQPRSTLTAPVPVDVIKGSDLSSQGSTDIIDTLISVVPSLNAGREPISDAATLIRPVNLRALPSDHTLVLVNGKRRHRGAVVGEFVSGVNRGAQGVDVNPLFGTSLKSVEILRDGAAAQYGSDAIAGVINYTLSDDPEARKFVVQYGSTYKGDGTTLEAAALVGFTLGDEGFLTVAMNIKDQEATSRGVQDGAGTKSGATALAAAGFPVAKPTVVVWGQPEVKNDYKFAVNMAVPMGTGEVYSFGTYATREVDGSFFYRNPTKRSGVFVSGGNHLFADLTGAGGCPVGPLPTTSFADAQAFVNSAPDNCFSFFKKFPGGFTPRFGGVVVDTAITAGFRGEMDNGLTYDFSAGIGKNSLDYKISNTINASLGPDSPTSFDLGSQSQTELIANADFTYQKDVGLASDLNIAFGAQYQTEEFAIGAGDAASYAVGPYISQGFSAGSNGFQGFNDNVAGAFSRNSVGAYVDLEADVTERLILSGAARFENFSDFGKTFNVKLAGLFAVTDNLNLRGSISTGFRAPTLGQSNLQRASTGFANGVLTEQLVIASTNPIAKFFGGGQLDPEKARNISLGFTAKLGDLSVTADYFNIQVKDRVALTFQGINATQRQALLDAGIPEAATIGQVNFFVNDFDTKTSGVDVVANYTVASNFGDTDFTVAFNYNDTNVTNRGATITDARAREIEESLPTTRTTFTISHKADAFDGLIRANHFSSVYDSLFNDPSLPIETPSIFIVDAEIGYTFNEAFRVAIGAKNLLNAYPEEWTTGKYTGRDGGFLGAIYPLNHPAGFNGGSYYLQVSSQF